MIWIVSGPSSVGKSTFMASPRCAEITGLPAGTPTVWPQAHERLDGGDLFYHYNILRPIHLKRRRAQKGQSTPGDATSFDRDLPWKDLTGRDGEKGAVVLVANKRTMVRRALERRAVEHSESEGRYRAGLWARLLRRSDLPAIYAAWCEELRAQTIPFVVVNAEDDSYPVIDEAEIPAVVGDEPPYTEKEVRSILRRRKFEYHRVELPYGLHTPGQDRSETRDLVLPESLKGKTVLDVGSALGYFCFEAEARGAERVVGVELKASRLRDALLLADIKASNVEFFRRDILENPMDEEFDHILLLNVVHHLAEPVRAMRQLARLARERLVIEFPTFADEKFRTTARFGPARLYNRLPVIGVSSARKGVSQTYVFAPPAIERALTDHERLFESVEILRSPMPGRAIAVCRKG